MATIGDVIRSKGFDLALLYPPPSQQRTFAPWAVLNVSLPARRRADRQTD